MFVSRSASSSRSFPLAALLLAFACSAAFAGNTPAPPVQIPVIGPDSGGVDYLQHVIVGRAECDTCLPRVCPGEPVLVTVSGILPNHCYAFRGLHELEILFPGTLLSADFVVDSCGRDCVQEPVYFSGSVSLPPQAAGSYRFGLQAAVRSCPDTTVVAERQFKTVAYDVRRDCEHPVPVDSLVRTFVRLDVAPEHRCPGDSLALRLIKNGCPPCVHLTGLELDSLTGFHATLDWRPSCLELVCHPETLTTPLGRFLAGSYRLAGRVDVHVLDAAKADSTISFDRMVAFDVPRTCDTTITPCMFPFLLPGALRSNCALTVPPGGHGDLWLSAIPPVELGGLQGHIDCTAPFRVVGVRAPDGARNLHVSSAPDGRGARYLVFTDAGFPIPSAPGPVLVLDVAADPGAVPGSRAGLFAAVTLASDPNGVSVPLCQVIRLEVPAIPLCVAGAPDSCDANGDGHADVRDLVLMTHCFRHLLSEADSARICRDCNGDSLFSFDDLFCCARHILRGPLVPRDSVHADGTLRVSFDPPRPFGDGLLVSVHVTGAQNLGAVLVRLVYPAERWRASLPVFIASRPAASSEGWLTIADVDAPGTVQLGGVRLGETASGDIEFQLVFTPIAAPLAGDRIEVAGADLAAPDGTVLTPPGALPTLTLDAPQPPDAGVLELSPARPNPFTTTTSFAVNLPRAAQVDLAVHDLAGRRVATVVRGAFDAGRRTFSWDGSKARDGLYFVRLTVDGRVLSTRVALLRNRP